MAVDLKDFEYSCPFKEIIWWDTVNVYFKFIYLVKYTLERLSIALPSQTLTGCCFIFL